MKTKLIVFIVIILILSGCNGNKQNSTSLSQEEIQQIFFNDNAKYHPSHKQDKAVYLYIIPDYVTEKTPTASKTEGLYIQFVDTKVEKLLTPKTDIESESEISIGEWSPDDKYLILDTGSYVEREKIIINSQTGKVITKFGTMEISYKWLISDEIVFTDLENDFMRPYQGAAHGIAIINLNTGVKTILKHATETVNYSFTDIVENNKIIFCKTVFKPIKPEEFKYGKEEESYWIMDKDGKNEKQVEVEFAYYKIKTFKYK